MSAATTAPPFVGFSPERLAELNEKHRADEALPECEDEDEEEEGQDD